jgi:hypothetical protein
MFGAGRKLEDRVKKLNKAHMAYDFANFTNQLLDCHSIVEEERTFIG